MHSKKLNRYLPIQLAGTVLLGAFCGAATLLAPDDPVPGVGEAGGPTTELTPAEMQIWLAGREAFDRFFDVGLGLGLPNYNANSCGACHMDPVLGGAGALELNVSRFGHDGAGTEPFANLPGGQAASKLRPPPDGTRENYPTDMRFPADNADVFEQRQTPTVLGLGLMDSISDATILENEDPGDFNGDGIFGVARILTVAGNPEVGRFGWKAQVPHIGDFVRDAMGGEIGITTPDDGRGFAFLTDTDAIADPELSQEDTDEMTFFLGNLGPPIQADQSSPSAQAGKALFLALKCSVCHISSLKSESSDLRVNLFSDLLLHNVQAPGFHGMAEPGADSGMYRTTPLWGLKDTAPYWHDGRAETIQQAITTHHSEGEFSSTSYLALSPASQADLLTYLMTL